MLVREPLKCNIRKFFIRDETRPGHRGRYPAMFICERAIRGGLPYRMVYVLRAVVKQWITLITDCPSMMGAMFVSIALP